ncbi:MAG: 23S rRNA (pseudouridine(1915)-N(3))-methyltransferase RlmH [Wenzhouxiangellaceae bacterium]|nr:23S rRNA (pseudouridine(1915)-N(3))-methyltransferase RlmH [Wenzhouxiangellaceae bacterium]
MALHIQLIAIGRSMPGWVADGWREYARRLSAPLSLELVELAAPRAADADRVRQLEGQALLKRCTEPTWPVALDGSGAAWSTAELAEQLRQWLEQHSRVALLVGGADGHDRALLDACRQRWSLGPLTFPHMLVRVIVAEQLYRAWSLLAGHPYHRA